MIELLVAEGSIHAKYRSDLGEPVEVDVSVFAFLGQEGLKVLKSLCQYIDRLRARSASNYLKIVVDLGRSLKRVTVALPSDEAGWQSLVLRIHEDIITNTESKASIKTRLIATLSTINTFLTHLKSEDIVPMGVLLPPTIRLYRSIDSTPHSTNPLIGHSPSKRAEDPKLLCDISLSRTDADYLDFIRGELTRRRHTVREALLGYWECFQSHVVWGRKAIEKVDVSDLRRRLEEAPKAKRPRRDKRFDPAGLLSPHDEAGLANLVAYLHDEYDRFPSNKDIRESPYLPRAILKSFFAIAAPDGLVWNVKHTPLRKSDVVDRLLPRNEQSGFSRARLRWMLGFVSTADIAVMSALLIMDHPRFTPEAVTRARLVNRHGKRLLQMGDSGELFAVHKHRAHLMKQDTLTELGLQIINFSMEVSSDIRRTLQTNNSALADLLFIQVSYPSFTPRAPAHYLCGSFLSGAKLPSRAKIPTGQEGTRWLGDFCPSLKQAGLGRRAISLRKIRNTEGVLEWFRTQNLSAVARKLGNKTKTVIDHYIPKALLLAWNTRMTRRFQNLWIAVAVADESFLLEVTDFASLTDLHEFLAEMLHQHSPRTSPLAFELHERFSKNSDAITMSKDAELSKLSVSISKSSLAALYLYHDSALSGGVAEITLDTSDSSGLTPRHFIDLSTLLQCRLPEDANPEHRKAHYEALELTQSLRSQINWGDFFLEKNAYA